MIIIEKEKENNNYNNLIDENNKLREENENLKLQLPQTEGIQLDSNEDDNDNKLRNPKKELKKKYITVAPINEEETIDKEE